MSEQDIPRLQMHHPGEVAELIPYLVGFTPEESLVAIVTRNGRVEVTARVEAAARGETPPVDRARREKLCLSLA